MTCVTAVVRGHGLLILFIGMVVNSLGLCDSVASTQLSYKCSTHVTYMLFKLKGL